MMEPIVISDGEDEDRHSGVVATKDEDELGFEILSQCKGTNKGYDATTSKSPISTPSESPIGAAAQVKSKAAHSSVGNTTGLMESVTSGLEVVQAPPVSKKKSDPSPLPDVLLKTTAQKGPVPKSNAVSNTRLGKDANLEASMQQTRSGSRSSSQPHTQERYSSQRLRTGGNRKRHLSDDDVTTSQEYQSSTPIPLDGKSPSKASASSDDDVTASQEYQSSTPIPLDGKSPSKASTPASTKVELEVDVAMSAVPKRVKVDTFPVSDEAVEAKPVNENDVSIVGLQTESSIFAGITWTNHVHTRNVICLPCKLKSGASDVDDLSIMEILNEYFVHDEKVKYESAVPLESLFETAKARYAAHVPKVISLQLPRTSNWDTCQSKESRPCSDVVHNEGENGVPDVKTSQERKTTRKTSNSPSDSRSSRKSGQIATEDTTIDIDPSEIPQLLDQIPDGYVFYPSEEEFMDPALYLRKVYPLAAATGVFKIVPPPSWRNKSAIDNLWPIRTNIQPIHQLITRDATKEQNFGYEPGPQENSMWVAKYEAAAKTYKDVWLRRNHVCDESNVSPLTSQKFGREYAALERQYWTILSSGKDPVFTLYANDMDSREIYGPEHETFVSKRKPDGCPIVHPWSLMVLPKYPDMLLSALVLGDETNPKQAQPDGNKDERLSPSATSVDDAKMRRRMRMSVGKLSGVCQPWIYFGMLFSSFCWHVEDNNLYSINYLHEGQSKFWYGIPPDHAQRYEMIFNRLHSDKFQQDWNNIYYNINTMMNPAVLVKNGVKVFRLVQHPGEIIITVPESYHAGFSTGYNCAEAVNFALPNWFPKGLFSERRYLRYRHSPVFSNFYLLYRLFNQKEDTIRVTKDESRQMKSYYIDCLNEEKANRRECEKWYGPPKLAEELRHDEEPMCFYCEQPCPFSVVKFNDMEEDERSLCLRHGASLKNVPECGFLIYYVSLDKLENALRHADTVCNIQEFETFPDTPEIHNQIRNAICFDQKSSDFCPACECRSERKAPWACPRDLGQWFGSKLMDSE
eukprot:CAMPEP_0184706712 /NCGR_PEP_ID=MMETSP0313-20130426/36895_1 /TAXON_ID=2792 /ORGANISM="Porphyridium aerugineum, Strain SAG 1380-2" /LENGTH=1027 /DNA_ID=CAMNT_0027168273 /DNA_START=213 /DNA_END=3297 /DNA_ORIENTATION=-